MTMTREQSLAQLAMYCDANSYPEIDASTLAALLDEYVRFATWQANTVYAIGDRVVGTVPNGRVYECRLAGTSGATAPVWPTDYALFTGFYIVDGATTTGVTWVDQGPVQVQQYDVRAAARAAWLYKAGRVANQVDAKEGTTDVALSALHKQLLAMAERYRPMVVVV